MANSLTYGFCCYCHPWKRANSDKPPLTVDACHPPRWPARGRGLATPTPTTASRRRARDRAPLFGETSVSGPSPSDIVSVTGYVLGRAIMNSGRVGYGSKWAMPTRPRMELTCGPITYGLNEDEYELVKAVDSVSFFFNGVWIHANFLAKLKFFFAKLYVVPDGVDRMSSVSCVKIDPGNPDETPIRGSEACRNDQIFHPSFLLLEDSEAIEERFGTSSLGLLKAAAQLFTESMTVGSELILCFLITTQEQL